MSDLYYLFSLTCKVLFDKTKLTCWVEFKGYFLPKHNNYIVIPPASNFKLSQMFILFFVFCMFTPRELYSSHTTALTLFQPARHFYINILPASVPCQEYIYEWSVFSAAKPSGDLPGLQEKDSWVWLTLSQKKKRDKASSTPLV